MSPKLTPEQKRRRLFQRISGIAAGHTGPDGIIRIRLTQTDLDDLEEGKKDLAGREARYSELSEEEKSQLAADQDTMNQTLFAIQQWGS